MLKPSQKKKLNEIYNTAETENRRLSYSGELTTAEYNQIKKISNHETLIQDIDRHLFDLYSKNHSFMRSL